MYCNHMLKWSLLCGASVCNHMLKWSLLCGASTPSPNRPQLYLLYRQPPPLVSITLIDRSRSSFRRIHIPLVSGYFYGLTASVYLHLYLRGNGHGCLFRMYLLQLITVGRSHYYNIERNNAGTILI
jgi:hypothetical protein